MEELYESIIDDLLMDEGDIEATRRAETRRTLAEELGE